MSHGDVIRRALIPAKPFVEGGRGYRDAVVWYTIIELVRNSNEDVVFITENSTDWSEGKESRFHHSFLEELEGGGLPANRLLLLRNLAEFNRRYTVSTLPVEEVHPARPEKGQIDYLQLLVDGKDLIAWHMLLTLPDLVRKLGDSYPTPGELGLVAVSRPENVRSDAPRILDSERRLLQFSADYRLSVDLVVRQSEVSRWVDRFNVHMRHNLGDDWVHIYATLPVRAGFHMIQRGENTEQFSLTSAEIVNA